MSDTVSIIFFHDTACGTCDGTEDFCKILSEKVGESPYTLYTYNVFQTGERKAAESALLEYDIKIEDVSFPAMLIHGKLYEGLESIEQNLEREYLKNAAFKVIYYYRDDCEECVKLQPFVESLPQSIVIGNEEVPLSVEACHSRKGDNGDRIRTFFELYQVPEEEQIVPFMVLGDKYLAGAENIQKDLMRMLEQGYGLVFSE